MSAGRERGSDSLLTKGRESSDVERAAAVRAVARMATDEEDREQLLAALGLTDD